MAEPPRPEAAPKIEWQEDVVESSFPNLPLSVRVVTWNVGGRPISAEDDFSALLTGGGSSGSSAGPSAAADICVVGLQELVELNGHNIFWASEEEELSTQAAFESHVAEELGRSGLRYSKVGSIGMVGLFLTVYIKEDLFPKVSGVALDRVKTGLFHLTGNKGAVCLRFDLEGVSFCFLNLHLAAGQENQAARNQDIDDALRYCFQEVGAYGTMRNQSEKFHRESAHSVVLHHIAVVFGDFNFRLEVPEEVAGHKSGADACLLEGDPLSWLQYDPWRNGLVEGLDGFVEGKISFPPTYKYRIGTDELDTKRLPAWCDRVLYKAMPNVVAQLCEYTSLMELKHTSDHRPVVAMIEVHNKPKSEEVKQTLKESRSWMSWATFSWSAASGLSWGNDLGSEEGSDDSPPDLHSGSSAAMRCCPSCCFSMLGRVKQIISAACGKLTRQERPSCNVSAQSIVRHGVSLSPPSPLKPRSSGVGGRRGQALRDAELVSLDERPALERSSDGGTGTCPLLGAPSEEHTTASGTFESRQSWAKDEDEVVRG
mmetsp:Transcript_64967/g.174653  ORF Transcript_64967/g.174653 Transcript_64967/m.174653 type:complete len:541 (-) Transcript_64967:254-1876(-)